MTGLLLEGIPSFPVIWSYGHRVNNERKSENRGERGGGETEQENIVRDMTGMTGAGGMTGARCCRW